MGVEQMITEAILIDRYSGPLRKMAAEQDAYARRTNAINAGGNVLVGAGSAMIGLAAKAVKVAASYDQQRQAFGALLGSTEKGKAMFDDLAKFTVKTPFQLSDWTHATRTLMGMGVAANEVMPALKALGNAEAAQGRSGASLQTAAYELGEMRTGYLSMQQIRRLTNDGLPAVMLLKKELHLTGEELSKIGKKHIDGKVGFDALLKGIADPSNHLDKGMETQMGTLPGSITSLKDNWNLFLDQMGEPALRPITNIVNGTSGILSNLQQMSPEAQKIVTLLAYGSGPVMTVGGGVLKSIAAYRAYKGVVDLATAAGKIERAGEAAKPGIAKAEGAALEGVTGKYGGLISKLKGVGTATLGEGAAAAGVTRILAAGIGTVGLYAVALGGLAYDIKLVVDSFGELNKASRDFEASTAALNKAKAEGYDFKAGGGQPTGYAALPVWKQYGEELVNGVAGFATYGKYQPFDTTDSGSTAMTDAASNALAKAHGRPYNGVTATMLRDQAAQRAAAKAARREAAREAAAAKAAAAGEAANKYELPPEFQYRMEHDKRQFDYLNRIDPDSKREESARKTEIEDLMKARDLLLEKAKLATDPKAKYKLMGQADEYDFEAQNMDVTKEKKDKRDKLDKHIATILGAGGLSEQEFLKRSGINGRYLSQLGKAPSHENTVSKAIKSLASRSMIINLQISPKIFEQVRADIKDEIFRDLEKVMSGSSPRAIFGGN